MVALLLASLAARDARAQTRPGPPPTPEEVRRGLQVEPGLKVELAACEPEVMSPVAMAFREDGALCVAEMLDYPLGPAPGAPPASRVRVLRDRDGDGFFETAAVFAGKLQFANGVLPWRGGLVVTAAPRILYLEDTDGDGRADRRETLYEGFSTENSQLLVNHPTLGLDGWVHVANGLKGGTVRRAGDPAAAPVALGSLDFRFDLLRRREGLSAGMSQFGLTFDAWGRRFACDNRHHLRHAVIDARYLARNPHLAAPELLEDVSELEPGSGWAGSPVHPLSANWTNMPSHAGRFTSACGVFIYTGDLLPEPHRGAAFTCEPSGNLVHEEVLRPHGATFRSRPARPGVEFLASASTWFRPVDLACGPDGALYVADMARAVVEHPAWLPGETANRLDFLAGKERGRIWRIVPRGAERGRPPPAPATVADQVALLSHPSGWWRATAHRLLLQSAEPLPVAALAELVRPGANPHAALHAAWLFAARDGPGKDGVLALLASAEPRLRAHGLILAESRLGADADVEERALALARDPDAAVRFQAALTLGAWQDERVLGAWREIAAADAGDRWTRLAIASGAGGRAGRLIAALFRGPGSLAAAQAAGGLDLLRELAVLVGSRRDTAEAAGVIAALEELAAPDPRPWRVAGLAGLAEGARRRGTRVDELLAGADAAGGPGGAASRAHSLMAAAGELARETGRGPAERIEAVRLLAHAPWEEVSPVLAAILAADPVDEARIEAARALAAHAAPGVAALLLAPWEGAGRALRAAILDGLVRDPARALELLAEVEAGRIQAADLGSARIDRLLEASREDVQAKARGLLAAGPPAERREVLARYQRALAAGGADPVRGRAVFAKHCAPCHRLLGTGVLAGPDIGDLSARAPEALLSDILDPNRAIDASYVSYTVTTRAGETLSGIIQAETPAAIVLRGAEGKTDAVLRADIAELRSSGASLMPEGLEQAISEREMADLIALLKGWRELDPATAGAPGDRAGTPFSGK